MGWVGLGWVSSSNSKVLRFEEAREWGERKQGTRRRRDLRRGEGRGQGEPEHARASELRRSRPQGSCELNQKWCASRSSSASTASTPPRTTRCHQRVVVRCKSATSMGNTSTFIDVLLALILPPLGVFLKFGCQVRPLAPRPLSLCALPFDPRPFPWRMKIFRLPGPLNWLAFVRCVGVFLVFGG